VYIGNNSTQNETECRQAMVCNAINNHYAAVRCSSCHWSVKPYTQCLCCMLSLNILPDGDLLGFSIRLPWTFFPQQQEHFNVLALVFCRGRPLAQIREPLCFDLTRRYRFSCKTSDSVGKCTKVQLSKCCPQLVAESPYSAIEISAPTSCNFAKIRNKLFGWVRLRPVGLNSPSRT